MAAPTDNRPSEDAPAPTLWVDRTGTRTGTCHNDRGASVPIGPLGTEGAFTPGELLAVALAACSLMSADALIARRLGDDVDVTAVVERESLEKENRTASAHVELRLDLSALDDEARAELAAVVDRAVAKACTVGRTLDAGMPHTLAVVDAADGR